MKKITVYKAEQDAGLAEKVIASCVLAYTSPLEKLDRSDNLTNKLLASVQETNAGAHDSDLYYIKSILATSNWNKNSDVFDKAELWQARNTPTHKPTNLDHDEHTLVGHITDNWSMDAEGKIIPDDIIIDDLPNLFHVVNGAVIYTTWQDQKLVDRTQALITAIESGKKFVSMECLFTNFDYAVITPKGQSKVIARNEKTAFLTKHLKQYGGTGVYDGNQLGRILRNITFSGKGYVDNPANPDSIILNDKNTFNFDNATIDTKNPFVLDNGVYTKQEADASNNSQKKEEKDNMSQELLEKRIAELTESLDKMETRAKTAEESLTKTNVEKLEAKIKKLEVDKATLTEQVEGLSALESAKEDLTKQLDEANARKTELEEEVSKAAKEKLRADRISTLVDGGMSKETAEEKTDKFENLSNEQFTDIANELIEAIKAKSETNIEESEEEVEETESSKDDSEEDENADAAKDEVLDNAEETESSAEAASSVETDEDDTIKETRKQLVIGLSNRLGYEVSDNETETEEN